MGCEAMRVPPSRRRGLAISRWCRWFVVAADLDLADRHQRYSFFAAHSVVIHAVVHLV
jgi:hypothetical protein